VSRARCTVLLAAGLVVAGCEERPPIVAQGRRVAVAPYFDAPVCAGSVASFDAVVERIEGESGLRGRDLTTFFWGPDAVKNCASDTAFSCASPENDEVHGYVASLSHEIAHVIGGRVGVTASVVEEGFAISHGDICVSSDGAQDRLHSIREYVDLANDEIHGSGGSTIAGHFAIHLSRIYGPQLWSDFKAETPPGVTADELASAFEAAYAVSLDDAEREWFSEAPEKVCPPAREPVTMWTGHPLTLTHDLDCGAVDTLGPFDRTIAVFPSFDDSDIVEAMYVQHRVAVPFVDEWHVELDGPAGARAIFYGFDCIDHGPLSIEQEREILAGDAVDLPMDACTQLIIIAAPPDQPARVELRITRTEGGA